MIALEPSESLDQVKGASREGNRPMRDGVAQAPSGRTLESAATAGVVQWQNGSFPSFIRGFDSLHPLHFVHSDGRPAQPALSCAPATLQRYPANQLKFGASSGRPLPWPAAITTMPSGSRRPGKKTWLRRRGDQENHRRGSGAACCCSQGIVSRPSAGDSDEGQTYNRMFRKIKQLGAFRHLDSAAKPP